MFVFQSLRGGQGMCCFLHMWCGEWVPKAELLCFISVGSRRRGRAQSGPVWPVVLSNLTVSEDILLTSVSWVKRVWNVPFVAWSANSSPPEMPLSLRVSS